MEMIVFYNKGKAARLAGLPRIAPETVEYPVYSQFVPFHYVTIKLYGAALESWLEGYDGKYDRKSRYPSPQILRSTAMAQ